MPLRLPKGLPAIELLKSEGIFIDEPESNETEVVRPLRIAVLNLMPKKIETETDLCRLLSASPLPLELHLMKLRSHVCKNTPIEHMQAFYRFFDEMREERFDGLIVTGAPVEHLEFEEVHYWDELGDIFTWSRTHVTSTLYIHYYTIP